MPPGAAALTAYQGDYAQWVEDTARAIEECRFDRIDRTALADEVRDLGKPKHANLKAFYAFC